MVATRRQAPKAAEDETMPSDPELALKKKPVRKATAKTIAKAEPKSKAKVTRGKKAEIDPEPEVLEVDQLLQHEPPKATKTRATRGKRGDDAVAKVEAEQPQVVKPATRKGAGRPKKSTTESTAVFVEEDPAELAKATRATKAGSFRGKKVAAAIGQDSQTTGPNKTGSMRGRKVAQPVEEAQTAPGEPKSTRSTTSGSVRGRKAGVAVDPPVLEHPEEPKQKRSTRGAAVKSQPLSPKKVTQVSKPQPRATRNAGQKPAVEAAQLKVPAKTRGATRKRTVSDENADVPDLDVRLDEVHDDDVAMLSSTPVKTRRQSDLITQPDAVSEVSMSSRPTTPTDSTMLSSGKADEQSEDDQSEADENLEDDQTEAHSGADEEDANDSDDELCGPKTPMRRSSPGATARYHSSAQRTIRKFEDLLHIETPARRQAVQRGTPQTQKPYRQPAAPSSEVRPMTVARATGRAFVFRDLRDGVPAIPENETEQEEVQDEASFIPDEDIIPIDEEETPVPEESTQLSSPGPDMSVSGVEQHEPMMIDTHDEDDFVAPAAVQKFDDEGEETVLIQDAEETYSSPLMDPVQSLETEDTVIITRLDQVDEEDTMLTQESESEVGSVIISPMRESSFQDVERQDAIIAVKFDEHLINARQSPVKHDLDDLGDSETSLAPTTEDVQDAIAGAEMEVGVDLGMTWSPEVERLTIDGMTMDVDGQETQSDGGSRRQTVNFDDFIDVDALAEPTESLQIADTAVQTNAANDNYAAQVDAVLETSMEFQPAVVRKEDAPNVAQETTTTDGAEKQARVGEGVQEDAQDSGVPHYALPTLAFDARRKSLPATSHWTPVKTGTRPNTSDGASAPRIANPFANAWWSRSTANSTATTPVKARPGMSYATLSATTHTPVKARTSKQATGPAATPKERFPVFAPREDYGDHASTVAAPVRFQSPAVKSPKRRETFHKAMPGGQLSKDVSEPGTPAPTIPDVLTTPTATPRERYPRLGQQDGQQDHAKTVAAPVRFQAPPAKSPKRRETFHKAASGRQLPASVDKSQTPAPSTPQAAVETPQGTPGERYPRRRPRTDYEEYAKTVGAPRRFHTPAKAGVKRPATALKPESLRKAALTANVRLSSHTPVKTPLKAPPMTPAQEPMTPHPAAPLRGVTALVEIFTLEGASASAPFVALLHRLGAKTTRAWTDRVTHVVFKDGSPTTLQRVRLNNKEVEQDGNGSLIHCVNSRWVTDCDTEGAKMDESEEAYAIDVDEVPRGGKRRRKSMEPSALMNLGGNIVRDRKSSVGRTSSFGRSSVKFDSPAKKPDVAMASTPEVDVMEKENSADEQGSPATPAWIAAPDQLVQQTAPMNRVRKLELEGKGKANSRRLTFWNGPSVI